MKPSNPSRINKILRPAERQYSLCETVRPSKASRFNWLHSLTGSVTAVLKLWNCERHVRQPGFNPQDRIEPVAQFLKGYFLNGYFESSGMWKGISALDCFFCLDFESSRSSVRWELMHSQVPCARS